MKNSIHVFKNWNLCVVNLSKKTHKLATICIFRNNRFKTQNVNSSIINSLISTAKRKAACLISGRGGLCLCSGLRSRKNSLRFRIRLANSQLFSGKRTLPLYLILKFSPRSHESVTICISILVNLFYVYTSVLELSYVSFIGIPLIAINLNKCLYVKCIFTAELIDSNCYYYRIIILTHDFISHLSLLHAHFRMFAVDELKILNNRR